MDYSSKRTGLIAQKLGMTQLFNSEGKALAVTLLKAEGNVVIANKTKEKDGYNSLVLGFGEAKANSVKKPVKGMCAKVNTKPVKVIKEFRVAENAMIAPGSKLIVDHFVADQYVDIHGINIGKGFAGAMKRWNFRGLEASHGVSVSHRSHGSTGQRQDPGKTFKGKKMAGHMGAESVTIQNVKVIKIDSELGIIAVNGSVPGKKGSIVTITDAIKLALAGNVKYPAATFELKEDKADTVPVTHDPEQQQN